MKPEKLILHYWMEEERENEMTFEIDGKDIGDLVMESPEGDVMEHFFVEISPAVERFVDVPYYYPMSLTDVLTQHVMDWFEVHEKDGSVRRYRVPLKYDIDINVYQGAYWNENGVIYLSVSRFYSLSDFWEREMCQLEYGFPNIYIEDLYNEMMGIEADPD